MQKNIVDLLWYKQLSSRQLNPYFFVSMNHQKTVVGWLFFFLSLILANLTLPLIPAPVLRLSGVSNLASYLLHRHESSVTVKDFLVYSLKSAMPIKLPLLLCGNEFKWFKQSKVSQPSINLTFLLREEPQYCQTHICQSTVFAPSAPLLAF